ncbi:MAG: HPr(Ser) kinase/phosphatase [Verrucomicrobiota bacterium]
MARVTKKSKTVASSSITVGQFYSGHAGALSLKLAAGSRGMDRVISEGSVNRLGLALTGFFKYFANRRVQLIGSSEMAYIRSLSARTRKERIRSILAHKIPCIIISRNIKPPQDLLDAAEHSGVPLFISPIKTMRLVNAVTICLESDFAPTASEHGSMVDIHGVGALIRGESGIGKSECVLGLIERGYSLVSDDITRFRLIEGRDLMGTSAELTRHYIEVRGIGIINVASIFGASSIRYKKQLDLVVTLIEWDRLEEVDRIGLDQKYYEILQIKVPHVTIPVRPGRDLAGLVEVAALDQKLKLMGQFAANEFNDRLVSKMQKR